MKTIQGKAVINGKTEGYALVSKKSVVWSHGVDPHKGIIDDVKSDIYGKSIKDKILIYPRGKGSTTSSTWILEAARVGNAPKAIINQESEIIIATGSILSEKLYNKNIPIIHKFNEDITEIIKTGDYIQVDADNGTLTILESSEVE